MKVDIVIVHTGNEFPDYINDCISQLKKYEFNIHLIISECLINYLNHDDIIVVKAEDYFNDSYNSYEIYNHDSSFRDGFWKRTSSRFFLIASYSKINNLSSFFHLENDNLIFSDLTNQRNILDSSNYEMSVVIDSENRCIPSIMWFSDSNICQELSDYIFRNNTVNDMVNIFNFFKEHTDSVINLPILPNSSNISLSSTTGIKYSGFINYSNLYNEMNSIFDGAAIGQYLSGIDTRNNPRDTIGFINETTIFNVSEFEYIWENNEPYMINGIIKIKICNLHIHSKDLKKFIV